MQIYQATSDQLEDVATLFNQYRVFYRQNSDLKQGRQFIKTRLEQKDSVIFLGTENNKPLGYTQLFPSWSSVSMQRVWILNDLYVIPEARNQGVAKALMNAVRDYSVETKAVRLILATEVTNKIGQNLYESMGYRKSDDFYHYSLAIAREL